MGNSSQTSLLVLPRLSIAASSGECTSRGGCYSLRWSHCIHLLPQIPSLAFVSPMHTLVLQLICLSGMQSSAVGALLPPTPPQATGLTNLSGALFFSYPLPWATASAPVRPGAWTKVDQAGTYQGFSSVEALIWASAL